MFEVRQTETAPKTALLDLSQSKVRRAVTTLSQATKLLTAACVVGLVSASAAAADLEPRTRQAYDAYVEQARRDFLIRTRGDQAPALPRDEVAGAPARDDGIINVPGGLIHHWIGRAFLRGTALEDVIDVSKAYASYSRIYTSIIESQLLTQQGDTYRVLMRLKEGGAGITAVFELRSTVEHVGPSAGRAHALSDADEIREVQNAGRRDERLLPPGRDSGYLWRASTFTRFIALRDGVYVEMETLGLSRQFPPVLAWIIEPIARRLGRKSVETSLREFLAAVRMR
mgnify:CR=1 FL=1